MPDQPNPPSPEPVPNRAERRGAKKRNATAAAGAERYPGAARQSGSAHPGAQGRRVVPIRRTG